MKLAETLRVLRSSYGVVGTPFSAAPFSVYPLRNRISCVQPNIEPRVASHRAEHCLEPWHAYLHHMCTTQYDCICLYCRRALKSGAENIFFKAFLNQKTRKIEFLCVFLDTVLIFFL